GDRLPRVASQHEHRRMIGRILSPPAAPRVVAPGPAHGAEHVAAHYVRPDPFPAAFGKIIVGTCGPVGFPLHPAKRARDHKPVVERLASDAEPVVPVLARTGAVPVE